MLDFLKNFSYDNLVDVVICVISLLGGYFTSKLVSKKPIQREVLQKQLDLIYEPLFQKLEPNLYKKIDEQTAQDYITFFNNIKSKYYSLIDCKTLFEFTMFEKNFSKNKSVNYRNFSKLCYNIDKNFEKLRKHLGLPTRNFFYKWQNAQYPKNIQLRIKRLFQFLGILIVVAIIVLFVFSIIYLLSSFIASLIVRFSH